MQRPLTYYVLDNLGDVLYTYVFDGDGLDPAVADYVDDSNQLDPADAGDLRSMTETVYDNLGNVSQSMQYYVDQTAGTVGTGQNGLPGPEVTNDWYDADSNVVKVEDPNGNFTTYAYNGLGLQTTVTQPAITVFVATGHEPHHHQ